MFSRCALVLLLCLSTGLAATLIPSIAAEKLPSSPDHAAAEELNKVPEAEAAKAEAPAGGNQASSTQDTEDNSEWGLSSIRGSFQAVNGYFDSLLELMGGRDGVCQYRCRYGKAPQARPGYQMPEPNGCTSSLLGFQIDMGIPAMTKCCNQLDMCYDTCGSNKYRCDTKFRWCLHSICGDLKKSLGFVSKVEACEAFADTMYNTVWTLGCRPFMNSQRAACICEGEEKDEL
ncbi:group XIIB secretory phospholipase A2-like protein isoform X2 [Hemibagrus wyckioides]|uniref:group XIIB secretory phospholipase A2-like protein isoform X2 n=1 Tax=Hemibagrus wyckioides TaxID=337641 RepID=UPI00266D8CBD|nr:group XIIB secretory phospholipase A2-like protein isoform X2 [Hemibagrus wyckioides]